jgi:hypothetical protein
MIKIILSIIALVLFIGCSSQKVNEIMLIERPVPESRRFAYKEKISERSPSAAILVVARNQEMASVGCYTAFYINDILTCTFAVGEMAVFYLEPGKYSLKLGFDPRAKGICNCSYSTTVEIDLGQKDYRAFQLRTTDFDSLSIHQPTKEEIKGKVK